MHNFSHFAVSGVMIFLAACGDVPQPTDMSEADRRAELEAVWQEAQPIIEEELAREEARSAVRFPCTLYDKAAASALLNADLQAPNYTFEHRNEDANTWSSVACSWSSRDSGPDLNIWVSRPEHFEGGMVKCFGLESDDKDAPALSDRSSWWFQRTFGWARLRACYADSLFEVEIMDGPTDEAAARDLAVQVGQHLITTLTTVTVE
ncbi:MAG: hypothetical protein KZQ77_08110 [Candidatus Thiodiazotropha sp. (ex Notomyrtea botanica)]|nr:hypothetical protein [Candidatus Thiodiazotropha sp. (ex Notomyrtea botanica)]